MEQFRAKQNTIDSPIDFSHGKGALVSLTGAKGHQGPPGKDGKDGKKGDRGEKGMMAMITFENSLI